MVSIEAITESESREESAPLIRVIRAPFRSQLDHKYVATCAAHLIFRSNRSVGPPFEGRSSPLNKGLERKGNLLT